jgi:dienelactone hydrolase
VSLNENLATKETYMRMTYAAVLACALSVNCGGGGGGGGGPSDPLPNPPSPPGQQTVFDYTSPLGDYTIYLPPGTSTYRGVLLLAPGFGGDSRQVADRRFDAGATFFFFDGPEIQGYRALAQDHGMAVMGARLPPGTALNVLENLLAALAELAVESQHPELATAPLLLDGLSAGGCFAWAFTRTFPERVIGFRTQKGGCHDTRDGGAAKQVPGFLNIGGADTQSRCLNITALFDGNRPASALWALAVEPGKGHVPIQNLDVMLGWLEAVLALRLPAAAGGGLRPIAEDSGWLGDRETAAVAQFSAYDKDKSLASWLPSAQAAADWSAFVSPGRPLTCPEDPEDPTT